MRNIYLIVNYFVLNNIDYLTDDEEIDYVNSFLDELE